MKSSLLLMLLVLSTSIVQSQEEEQATSLTAIDVLSTLHFDYYLVPRVRWGELNQASGYRSSSKLFSYKKVQTGLGEMSIPQEDSSKLKDLSDSEFLSVLKTKQRMDTEDDTLLGLELLSEGEFEDAMEILQNVLQTIISEYDTTHVLYGNALADVGYGHYLQKHYVQAMDYYTQAVAADATHVEQFGARNYAASANMLAICAMKSGQKNVAAVSAVLEKAFDSLLKASDTERYKILLNLANIYLTAWMPIRAIAMLKLARHVLKKEDTEHLLDDVYVYLGTAYIMREEFSQAKKLLTLAKNGFEKRQTRNGFYVECLFQLAQVELLLPNGDAEDAFQQLSKVKELFQVLHGASSDTSASQKALIVCTMGQALRQLGEIEKAIMFIETASSLTLNDVTAKSGLIDLRIAFQLARLYQELGQLDKLKPLLQSSVEMADHLLGKKHQMTQHFAAALSKTH